MICNNLWTFYLGSKSAAWVTTLLLAYSIATHCCDGVLRDTDWLLVPFSFTQLLEWEHHISRTHSRAPLTTKEVGGDAWTCGEFRRITGVRMKLSTFQDEPIAVDIGQWLFCVFVSVRSSPLHATGRLQILLHCWSMTLACTRTMLRILFSVRIVTCLWPQLLREQKG